MKAPSPAFSLYPKDMLSDEQCAAMTNEEFGCYVRLLCHAWLEGSVPADPVRLQRILKLRPQTFTKVWPAIAPCFEETDSRLYQLRLEKERSLQRERSVHQAARGLKGGRPIKSTKEKTRGFHPGNPSESLPSPSPSPETATTEKRIAVAAAPAPPFKSARAVDIYRRFYPDGEPSPVMFKVLRPLVLKHGWDVVEPEMVAFLGQSSTTFRSWPKFGEGFGTWTSAPPANVNGARKVTDKERRSMERALRLAGLGVAVDASQQRDVGPRDVGSGATPIARGSGRDGGAPGGCLPAGTATVPDGQPVETRRE